MVEFGRVNSLVMWSLGGALGSNCLFDKLTRKEAFVLAPISFPLPGVPSVESPEPFGCSLSQPSPAANLEFNFLGSAKSITTCPYAFQGCCLVFSI